ncbi:hypothetical protein CLF_109647 [Clonorchis sinensis]|uniref:Uncharacterized protein n=1 Tax=Clonorchis sinensis TaxID=79923 RepID=G7YJM4_CLOSI|nr:hypothetical protein CLF_109647 [Clonorchis sinensis]
MLRFMDSPVTVVKGAAIGEGIRSSVAAGSGHNGSSPSDKQRRRYGSVDDTGNKDFVNERCTFSTAVRHACEYSCRHCPTPPHSYLNYHITLVSKIDCDHRSTIHSFPTALEHSQLYSTKSVILQLAPKYPIMTPLPSSSSKRLLDPESPSAIPPVCSKKRLRARRPSSQPAHLSRPAKTVFQATSDCSVVLTDISLPPQPGNTPLSPLPVGTEVLNDLEKLRTRVHQMENEISALRTVQSIACLLNPDATCDPTILEKASIFIDTMASEICQRIECRHQVLIFNA